MRVVLDTNILVSGVLSPGGPPRRLLEGARAQSYELCTSATLLAELLEVLARGKFGERLERAGLTPRGIVAEIHRIAYLVSPQSVPPVISRDPDDDHVLACAVAARADLIVSGDGDLHALGGLYRGIPIVSAAEGVRRIAG